MINTLKKWIKMPQITKMVSTLKKWIKMSWITKMLSNEVTRTLLKTLIYAAAAAWITTQFIIANAHTLLFTCLPDRLLSLCNYLYGIY